MKIDVIIPVYRPTEKLHKVLYRLCRQTHLPEQIILLHTRDGIKLDVSVCKDRVSVVCWKNIREFSIIPQKARLNRRRICQNWE